MDGHIYHTFLAGWCAESAGARLEFSKKRFTDIEVNNAMHFIGDTTSGIYPGQITDDSEMEICLLNALIEGKNNEFFPLNIISEKYIEWYHSEPFDIGQTITFALIEAKNAQDILNNADEYNQHSESNGTLMRCIPLAIFGINKSDDILKTMVYMENELTHPNEIVKEITYIYCSLICNILREKKNNNSIENTKLLQIIRNLINSKQVLEWYNYGIKLFDINTYDSITNEGHIKHAFIFIIYFLKNITNYTYEEAIFKVIQCGGDTDTNAKIIGNLFGAFYGNCVPLYMSNIVLNFNSSTLDCSFFRRPYKYNVKYAINLLNSI